MNYYNFCDEWVFLKKEFSIYTTFRFIFDTKISFPKFYKYICDAT